MPMAAKMEENIEIPSGVTVERSGDEITVSGENGKNVKKLEDIRVKIDIKDEEVIMSVENPTKREKALLGTYASHVRNMVDGVQEDFEYKLKILYSHFPVKVRAEGDEVVIENFIGEKKPRKARLIGETKANIQSDEVTVTGPNREDVAQSAANIEMITRIKNTDPRVFQDGIYLIEKDGTPI